MPENLAYLRPDSSTAGAMPDVATGAAPSHDGTLDWVGMSGIAVPLNVHDARLPLQRVAANAQIYVDLADAQAKGIHMSRLYLLLEQFGDAKPLGATDLRALLADVVASHEGLSTRARLELRFDYLIDQPALKSDNSGWKAYPVRLLATLVDGRIELNLSVEAAYSSTCPCSAALARQLVQEQFSRDFSSRDKLGRAEVEAWLRSDKGSFATPHSQRSIARVTVALAEETQALPIGGLIELIETALKTPVQTAVKRQDEQEFARLNGHNLMFCEDAARRLKFALNAREDQFPDFVLRVEHIESLHAHDAVAIAAKGLEGGMRAGLT